MDRTLEDCGSQWHKWDFHVHTPYSILNNQFPCNPYDKDSSSFDEYVKTLFTKAVEKDVAAIGITDYFSIDGYKRIRTEYLDQPDKMSALFPNQGLLEKVKSIYVFPNVEFRLGTFVGKGAHAVNYHVIFSDQVSISNIEDNFLQRLQISDQAEETLPLKRSNIETVGRNYKRYNPDDGSDYRVGMERITVKESDILNALKNSIFADKYMITIPVDEDLSTVDWRGRDYPIRKVLYQQCHCFLTSNAGTKKFALAKGHEEAQIAEFGGIKPCIWGSDAHCYDKMFEPAESRYCWIKAELSFEGLRQILEEPEDRVRIQESCPSPQRPHQTIDYIRFDDPRFSSEPIYFNGGLNCIIGGKSTGKSILLRHIANTISPSTVKKKEEEVQDNTSKLEVRAKVVWQDGVWQDGTSDERKIIYVPQSFLNRTVDNGTSDSPINRMIEELLLQNEEVQRAYGDLQREAEKIVGEAKHDILDFIKFSKKADECEKALQANGRVAAFEKEIDSLTKERDELTVAAGITPEIIERYNNLNTQIRMLSESIDNAEREKEYLSSLKAPIAYIPGVLDVEQITAIRPDGFPSYNFSQMPMAKSELEGAIARINETIREIWAVTYRKVQDMCERQLAAWKQQRKTLQPEFAELQKKISYNEQLRDIERSLRDEEEKRRIAVEREKVKGESIRHANDLKRKILLSRQKLAEAYDKFSRSIENMSTADTSLQFSAETQIKAEELVEKINALFDNRGFRPFRQRHGYDLSSAKELKIDDRLFEMIWDAMSGNSATLSFKRGNTFQFVLETLFSDWNYIHYTVKSGNDTIDKMSKGKKALVLLEMLIHLEKGNCPILIDQPEDDLDNRSVYSDLVQYLKEKKRERQIIVVTHNANVVVGADAEEVIIANQDGIDARNHEYQFEYRSGAIENNRPVMENGKIKEGILYQKGIQDQICDILEGGKQAFEKRRNRYWGTKQQE